MLIKYVIMLFLLINITLFGGYFKVFHAQHPRGFTTYYDVASVKIYRPSGLVDYNLYFIEVRFDKGDNLYFSRYCQFETDLKIKN